MTGTYLVGLVFFNIVFSGLCGYIGFMKGYPFIMGAAFGLVLGCLGLVIVSIMPTKSTGTSPTFVVPPRAFRAGDAPTVYGGQPVAGTGRQAWVDPRTLPTTEGRVAGWYDDPYGLFTYRYWDGGDWTDHTSNGV